MKKKWIKKKSPNPRRLARRLAMQALYQWDITKMTIAEIETQFLTTQPVEKVDVPYFLNLLRMISSQVTIIDNHMEPILDRPITYLNAVELAILRIGVYEICYQIEVPYRVVIDEALRLAKAFGTVEGFKYVNAILDKIAILFREAEIKNVFKEKRQ